MESKLELNGNIEIELFLEMGDICLKNGFFRVAVPSEIFTKAELAERMTGDRRDMNCHNLFKKLIEVQILKVVKAGGDMKTYYAVDPKTYQAHFERFYKGRISWQLILKLHDFFSL